MKKLLWASMLVGVLGFMPNPPPADATAAGCLEESIDSCNADFSGDDYFMVSIRGWCYIIRSSICAVADA